MAQVTCIKCGTMYEVNTQDKYTCMVCGTILPQIPNTEANFINTQSNDVPYSQRIIPIATPVTPDPPDPPVYTMINERKVDKMIGTFEKTKTGLANVVNKIKSNKKNKMAIIVATAIFLVFIGFTFSSINCSSTSKSNGNQTIGEHDNSKEKYRKAIKSVLDQDAQIAASNTSSNPSPDELQQKVNQIRNIDLSQCPPEFQAAYIEHINAWAAVPGLYSDMKNFKDRYDSAGAAVEAFFRGMVFDFGMIGEAETERQRIISQMTKIDDNIKSSWHEVLKIAAKYDVDVSKYK